MKISFVDLLGYFAGSFLLLMASLNNQTHMRLCDIAGNLCFIAYGYLAGLMPVLILNSIILAMHTYRLLKSGDRFDDVLNRIETS